MQGNKINLSKFRTLSWSRKICGAKQTQIDIFMARWFFMLVCRNVNKFQYLFQLLRSPNICSHQPFSYTLPTIVLNKYHIPYDGNVPQHFYDGKYKLHIVVRRMEDDKILRTNKTRWWWRTACFSAKNWHEKFLGVWILLLPNWVLRILQNSIEFSKF